MIFLTNPRGRKVATKRKTARRKTKRKPPKGYRTWKGYMASIRPTTKRRKKRKAAPNPKRRRVPVAKRKRAAPKRRRRAAPVRRARRSYRRNQPALRGFVKDLTDGSVAAFQILSGKAVARTVPQFLNLPVDGPVGIATQAGIAVIVGMFAKQMFGAAAGKLMTAGALTAPVESMIVQAGIPILSPALSAYPGVAAYVTHPSQQYLPSGNAVASYPSDVALDAYEQQM